MKAKFFFFSHPIHFFQRKKRKEEERNIEKEERKEMKWNEGREEGKVLYLKSTYLLELNLTRIGGEENIVQLTPVSLCLPRHKRSQMSLAFLLNHSKHNLLGLVC